MERFSDNVYGKKKGKVLELFNKPTTAPTTKSPAPAAPGATTQPARKPITPQVMESAVEHLKSIMSPEEYADYDGTDSWAADIDAILGEWGYDVSEPEFDMESIPEE